MSIHTTPYPGGEQGPMSPGDSQDGSLFVLLGMWREEAFKPLGPFVSEGV